MKKGNFISMAVVALTVAPILAGCATETSEVDDGTVVSEDDIRSYIESPVTEDDIADPSALDDGAQVEDDRLEDASGTEAVAKCAVAAQAVRWFSVRSGSTQYAGYSERAVTLAWGRRTKHPTPNEHWTSNDGTRRTVGSAPLGAFVFWNVGPQGLVGLSDGRGGAWGVFGTRGQIAHISRLTYFRNYLGWKAGNCN